jgi:phosphopantothenoylcysteine synthetase/decarboxylase
MKVLLTSGGTKVPIDRVRSITNMSRGTFGAKIARQLLQNEDVELIYLGAKEFRMPFSIRIDFAEAREYDPSLAELAIWYEECKTRYRQITYKTFEEYAQALEIYVRNDKPDIVILAAAVSDYVVVDPVGGKIRSGSDLKIELEQAPKLITRIKEWCPGCCLVGFKLLVGSNDDELLEAAWRSLEQNGCSFVVANDLRDIRAGKHRLLIVSEGKHEEFNSKDDDPDYLARVVSNKALELVK